MKLSEEQKAKGRALVLGSDLPSLMNWVRASAPVGLDHALYEKTMGKCLAAGDFARAIYMHNAVFDTYDATAERVGIVFRRALGCVAAIVILGAAVSAVLGAVYLARLVFS